MLVFYENERNPPAPARQAPEEPRPRRWWFIGLGLLLGLMIWAYVAGQAPAAWPFGGAQ